MTVSLSPQKISKILRLYFSGMTQPNIAKKAGVDQSTVSHYGSKFNKRAGEIGLLAAGKEYGVFEEVDGLRSLSMELSKAKFSIEEAKEGVKIIQTFIKLGVDPDQHAALVEVCKAVHDPGFVQAALKLSKIQSETHKSYEQVISEYENITYQLPSMQEIFQNVQAMMKSLDDTLVKKKHEAASLEAYIGQLQKEAESKKAKMENELATKMKQLQVNQAEAEEVATLKKQLGKNGLDIPTLVKLAKEYGYGSKKG